jgi:hypothetical protein
LAFGPDIGLCGAAAAENDKSKTKIRIETGIVEHKRFNFGSLVAEITLDI